MIERYSRPEMSKLWSLENRFEKMLEVEKAVASVQAEAGLIPKPAAEAIQTKARFTLARIHEIEATTKHDVIAFVSAVAESVGEHGRYVHFALTSSDVLDTALALQCREAGALLQNSLKELLQALKNKIESEALSLCAGRTHGMHAEPTTFGMKLAGHWAEFCRAQSRLDQAIKNIAVAKLSGAVGTYSSQPAHIEAKVAARLGLHPETVATQVVPRDRHAELMVAIAFLGSAIERLAIELRHLQRTEVAEVVEGFSKGQKGSSAMPHKKNPISAENLTGCARLLRSYLQPAFENISLWHERDISHSAVERVIFADAFILADYAVGRTSELLKNLYVDRQRMRDNLALSQGNLFSSHLLLALVEKGLTREKAYELVQSLAHSLPAQDNLHLVAKKNPQVAGVLSDTELSEIFSGKRHLDSIRNHLKSLGFQPVS